jgi:hypothetical protein
MNPQMNMYAPQPPQPSWAPPNINGNTPSPVQQQQPPQPQHVSLILFFIIIIFFQYVQ